jgi:RNA polymerase sigma-70 factor (ECF subfamily)
MTLTLAEDAVQEAALRAWLKLDRLRTGSSFGPWFLGIVVRQCLSLRRQRWWRVLKLDDLGDRRIERPDDTPIQGRDLRQALGKLRPDEQVAVVLYFYLDMPVEQIATISRGSVSAVRGRLSRAVRKLRPDLEIEEALR